VDVLSGTFLATSGWAPIPEAPARSDNEILYASGRNCRSRMVSFHVDSKGKAPSAASSSRWSCSVLYVSFPYLVWKSLHARSAKYVMSIKIDSKSARKPITREYLPLTLAPWLSLHSSGLLLSNGLCLYPAISCHSRVAKTDADRAMTTYTQYT
jgi:hypothetical protein